MINIRDILKEKGGVVYSVSPEATVYECLEKMTAHNVGAVLVMESEKLKGIFTERDYMKKIILQERASRSTRVKEIMTANPVCVTLSNSVEEALSIMTKQHCRHLPVIEEGKLAGIVSIGDLVKKKISDMDATIKYLSDYISSEGYH
jgi:CBS domain-containing protein